jgi:hypothetical protein
MAKSTAKLEVLSNVSNGAEDLISFENPYSVRVGIQGSAAILFHGWNNEAVAEKSNAKKNSAAKKSDNLESYVSRNEHYELCIPGTYLRGAIIGAARFIPDPRSPRKSAMDLYKSAIIPVTELASLGVKDWDYIDRRRVVVQRSAITRHRPAMLAGWKCSFDLMVTTPEYISANDLRATIESAGRLIGLADFRPTFGRFGIISYEVLPQ